MKANRIGTAATLGLVATAAASAGGDVQVDILHHNDGESQLLGLSDAAGYGGVARFGALADELRTGAADAGRLSLLLSAGDNFLAGPEFNVSLENGVPFFDSIAYDLIGYDAMVIGNHEFDFGPDVLADFIGGIAATQPPFLSANIDVSPEPALQALADVGRIAASTVVVKDGVEFGVVGATTPNLPFISSPGDVVVEADVVAAIQAEIDALQGAGVARVIVVSHLQSVLEDVSIAEQVTGADVFIAGGGDELLADPGDALVPGDEGEIFGSYPLTAVDPDGRTVYVVTSSGNYAYVGRLSITFDASGEVVAVDDALSGPQVVVDASVDPANGVVPRADLVTQVEDPVAAGVEALATTVIAETEVPLDGRRSRVRSVETNYGNLIADALRWQATELAGGAGLPAPLAAFQNGGGIRNDSIVPAGPITALDTFDALPFLNFLAVFPSITPEELLAVVENAVSRITPPDGFPTGGTGRFAQVSGLRIVYNNYVEPGARVRSIELEDGTTIVQDGAIVPGAPSIPIVIVNFLATGGDEYPFTSPFEILGVTYQQALENYLEDGLGGVVSSAAYPEGGEGRIERERPDFDGDGLVGTSDLTALLAAWGACAGCPEDFDGDGSVGYRDLLIVLSFWDA